MRTFVEVIERVFGILPRFKQKDELLEEEFQKFIEDAVAAIDVPVFILMSETDWNPWQRYAENAAAAHEEAYRLGSSFCVVPDVDRKLIDDDTRSLPPAARSILADWLQDLCRRSA